MVWDSPLCALVDSKEAWVTNIWDSAKVGRGDEILASLDPLMIGRWKAFWCGCMGRE